MSQKKILAAVDGSHHSNKVVDAAASYAKLLDARIIFVYCHRKFPAQRGQPYRDKEIASIINESEKLVAPFLQRLQHEHLSIEERFMEEPAGEAISEVARIEHADLVIMGSRGLTNLAGLIVGSVTNRVLHTAPCSVLVVR